MLFRLNVLTVAVCSSYITLGLAQPELARSLWAVYAGVTFVLACGSLFVESREDHDE